MPSTRAELERATILVFIVILWMLQVTIHIIDLVKTNQYRLEVKARQERIIEHMEEVHAQTD